MKELDNQMPLQGKLLTSPRRFSCGLAWVFSRWRRKSAIQSFPKACNRNFQLSSGTDPSKSILKETRESENMTSIAMNTWQSNQKDFQERRAASTWRTNIFVVIWKCMTQKANILPVTWRMNLYRQEKYYDGKLSVKHGSIEQPLGEKNSTVAEVLVPRVLVQGLIPASNNTWRQWKRLLQQQALQIHH